jgi:SUR7/PalI family
MAIFQRRKVTTSPEKPDDTLTTSTNSRKRSHHYLRLLVSLFHLLALVFLILVCIGNLQSRPVLRSTYFLKIDLSNIIPRSVPNAVLINSIARSIGLHDFYQVGLWNFCEGFNDIGITFCSTPRKLYWFNPVEILVNELLAGATIALPGGVTDALRIVKIASHWMFGCFIAGTVLTFLAIFLAPLGFSGRPRWSHRGTRIFLREVPLIVLTFVTLLLITGASVVATVMFVIFRNVFQSAPELNVRAELGAPMLAFMWIASGFNLLSFLFQVGTCCGVCCCSGKRKAIKEGRLSSDGKTALEKQTSGARGGAVTRRFGWKNRRIGT